MTAPLLIVGGAALAAPWWAHHRARTAAAVPVLALDNGPVALWHRHVAAAQHALPDARLMHVATFAHGETYRIQLVPGRQSLAAAHSALPLIATGLRRPLDELVIEQDPDTTDPSQLRMQVITRSPIRETVLFDRPRFDGGRIHLGPHADGLGDATYRLYTRNSMWGGFLLGSIGSGKTRVSESIALTARAVTESPTTIFYVDGQDGASSSVLWRHAAMRAGADDSERVLAVVEEIMRGRQRYNVEHELSGFTPTRDRVGILIIVDECHVAFGRHPERWAHIARTGRKVGVAVLAADQYSDLRVFGNMEPLRSSLLAGNGLVLRTASRMAGNLIPGLALDPYELPALPGYGYTVAAKGDPDARTAPFRARYLPDRDDLADDPTIAVPSVQEWFEKITAVPLDPRAQEAREIAETALDVLAKRNAGQGGPNDVAETMLERAQQQTQPVDDNAGHTMAQRILTLFGERERLELPEIYNAVPGEPLRTVRYALKSLVDRGQLVRPDEGIYEIPAA